ncbi:MAG: sigma-70 family RNA polymerase sigma factor, partial [Planctomycetota bacterium]
AWSVLQEFTFAQVIKKCEMIIRSKISRSNPVITENGVAAEVYLRLDKAMRENKSATPKTAREYFGLAARNIRWQIDDLLRKPKNAQQESGVFADLAASTGVSTEVLKMDVWLKFWTAVSELPKEQREVFDLIWMNELSQYEAAKELGIKRDRVKDLWREIKIAIAEQCEETLPHLGRLG